ncbi:hypothetical protein HXX76_015608 [Chlamydomonas incerta]|uniref:LysM domain-containing protein n=1 Tax=Chlamydomonas incerta TaxID=51695 RepID=A0A835VPK2_CHLIN|nr:hypothetical protein HXX76_015608 [Chlamydomonas incerta]|eukprot:KAG2423010.1 hypothetical protein HXX76_015608 [Chlamydomonas incerta]
MLVPDRQDACLYYRTEVEAIVSASPSQVLPDEYLQYKELFHKFLPQYDPVTEAPNYLFAAPGEQCPLDASGCTASRRCVGLSPLAYYSQSTPRSCDQLWSPSRSFLFQIWSTFGEFIYFKEQGKEKSQVSFGTAFDTNQDGVYGFGFNEFPANAYRLNPDGTLSVHGCWKRPAGAGAPFGYTLECEEDPMMTSVGFGHTFPENSGMDNAPFLMFLTDLGDLQIVNRHGRIAWSFNGVPPAALQPIQWTLSAAARSSFLGDKFEAQCPEGAFVTGWSGLVWADVPSIEPCLAEALLSHPAGPLLYQALASYTRDNKFYVGFTMRCSDGSSVGVAKRAASSTVSASELLYTTATRSTGWVEPPCPGGYDQVRFQAAPFSRVFDKGYVTVRPLARCAATGKWTLYTAGLGFAPQELAASSGEPLDANAVSSLYAAIATKCGVGVERSQPEYVRDDAGLIGNLTATPPYRASEHLAQLQAQARLEDLAGGASCPPGQVLTGFFGKRMAILDRYRNYVLHSSMFPQLSSYASAAALDAFDELGLAAADLAGPGDGLSVTSLDGVFCAAFPAATQTQQAVVPQLSPASAAAAGAPDLGGGAVYLATAVPAGSVPASYATTTLGCEGAQITSLYSASNGVDITLIGVRCSDGRGESAGSYQPKLLESGNPGYVLDHACPQGYDAVKSSPGMGWDGLRRGQGISSLSFRCSSAASSHDGLDPDSDGRFWVQLGAAPVLVVNGSLFAASEVFVNNPQTWRCANDTVISRLVVHYTQGGRQGATLWRVHVYCSARPPPARDSSWFDIAARYGITLTDLLRSNPQVDSSQPLAAYNDTDVRVPQLCGAAATQPPVSTISSDCSKWWPTRNVTVTGAETCGGIATSFLSRNLLYLNTINNGVCPQASTVITRGMRLCIAPPSAVTTVSAVRGTSVAAGRRRHRRRGLLQQQPDPSGAAGAAAAGAAAAAAGGTCVLTSWVSVGQTCDDLCAMYNLDLGVFLRYNRGLDCSSLAVGMEVCVAVAPAGTARFRPQATALDDAGQQDGLLAPPHTPPPFGTAAASPALPPPPQSRNNSGIPPPPRSSDGTRQQRQPPPRRSAAVPRATPAVRKVPPAAAVAHSANAPPPRRKRAVP